MCPSLVWRITVGIVTLTTVVACSKVEEISSDPVPTSSANAAIAVGADKPPVNFADPAMTRGCPSGACTDVLALVKSSVEINSVPDDLTPSMQDAPKDLRSPDGGDCSQLPVDGLRSNQQPCIFANGVPSTGPMIALIGDSQAWSWSIPFAEVAKQLGYRYGLVFHAGCKMPDLTYPESVGYTDQQCRDWKKAAIDWVNQQKPAVVVVASGYAAQYEPPEYIDGYVKTLQALSAPGRQLFVMSNIPVLGQDSTRCIPAHTDNVKKCGLSTSSAVVRKEYQASADAAAKGGAGYVNMIPFMCTLDFCPAIIGHYGVYSNQSHISSTYAETLVPVIVQSLGLPHGS